MIYDLWTIFPLKYNTNVKYDTNIKRRKLRHLGPADEKEEYFYPIGLILDGAAGWRL